MAWEIGKVKMTIVREHYQTSPLEIMYVNADRAVVEASSDWAAPYFREDGNPLFSVHSVIIDTGDKVIMVDTCNGEHKSPETNGAIDLVPYLPALADAGYTPEDIDVVLCTHLHDDHIGWNTRLVDGQWVPTFPNARYLVSRIEYDFQQTDVAQQMVYGFCPRSTSGETIAPLEATGQLQLIEGHHRICDEVWIEPAPGHSPGHITVHIASDGKEALVTGDAIHHPIQFAAPHWKMFLDDDPDQAIATRKAIMQRVADKDVRVFGSHFCGDSCGFVTSVGPDSYRFD